MDQIKQIENLLKQEIRPVFKSYVDTFLQQQNLQHSFINEMSALESDHLEQYFLHFHIDTKNKPSILLIDKELEIHGNAFHELTMEEKENIVLFTSELNQNTATFMDILKKPCYIKTQSVKKAKTFLFQKDIADKLDFVKKTLNVTDLKDYKINGKAVFENIRPMDIHRLSNYFKSVLFKDHLIQAAQSFAEFEKVENVADFCAAGEFAVMQLRQEVIATKPNCTSKKQKEQAQKDIANEICNDKTKKLEYSILYLEIKQYYPRQGITFSSALTAATHYIKHGREICEYESKTPSVENYVALIQECTKKYLPKVYWSQDGSRALYDFSFKINTHNYKIILVENVATKIKMVATFFEFEKSN